MRKSLLLLICVWMSLAGRVAGQAQDCNGNGIDDSVDIANGTTGDCDGNGVPDICESSFEVVQTVAAPGVPLGLSAADFNGDGNLDLAYVDRAGNAAVVLLADGAGGFIVHNFAVGLLPVWLAVGDFNGDALPDLAVANAASNNVTILLNTGAGGAQTFSSFATLPVGQTPTFILAVDIDADGDLDLTVTEDGFQAVRTLVNNGQADFVSGGDQQVGFGPLAIATADFDGDGRNDLAVANETSNNLSVLLSGPNVPPPTIANFGGPVSLAPGDFDGDGRADLAVANFNTSTVLILLNNAGDGSFVPGQELTGAVNPAFVTAVDVNGDGPLDLLVADGSGVLLFLGRGDGTFTLTQRGNVGTGINSLVFAPVGGAQAAALDADAQQVLLLESQGPECSQPPPAAPQCGAGACGAGGVPMLGMTLAGLWLMRTGSGRMRRSRSR